MSLKISRILHAGYVFNCNNTLISFDPIFENPFSRNCYAFPSVKFDHDKIRKLNFAAVFISHFHDDHCSLDSLDLLDRNTPIYLYCVFDKFFTIIQQLGFKSVHPLKIDEAVKVGPFEIIPRRALDADVDSLFQVRAAGLNVLNVVDSWIDYETVDKLAEQGPWDMVMWPFQTMREIDVIAPSRAPVASREIPDEWIKQIKTLNPKYIVPSSCQFVQESWSWYNHAMFPITYQEFEQQIKSVLPNTNVVRMNPSVSFQLGKDSLKEASALNWIQPVGFQDVDYSFKPDLKPPTTAEVSKRFPPLSSLQTERVYEYCRRGLLEKFKSMDLAVDEYFRKPRLWRLSVYDHNGDARHFHYNLNKSSIELTFGNENPLGWSTEVPIAKLYAALENGESLTSMYVRVNDMIFAPEIEKEIKSADVVEDPLIRCLFNGEFASYQAAQLKRILNLSKLAAPVE